VTTSAAVKLAPESKPTIIKEFKFTLTEPVKLGADQLITELTVKIKPRIFADAEMSYSKDGGVKCNFYEWAGRALIGAGQPAAFLDLMCWEDVRLLGARLHNVFIGAADLT
jgi:hypothetical protein